MDFDPSGDDYTMTANGTDAYITFLGRDGNHLQAINWGGDSAVYPRSVCLTSDYEIAVSGYYFGEGNFNPQGTDIIPSFGQQDCFVTEFSIALLRYQWTSAWGSYSFDDCTKIAATADGGIVTTGYYQFTVDFDPGAGEADKTSNGSADIYTIKLDSSGELDN